MSDSKPRKERMKLRRLVIKPRERGFDEEDEDVIKQHKTLMLETNRLAYELGLPENAKMIPVFKIRLRRFIKENLPLYVERLI